jgi:hypothetical protein
MESIQNKFLNNAFKGRQEIWMAFLALSVTWVFWVGLGLLPLGMLIGYVQATDPDAALAYTRNPLDFEVLGLPTSLVFIAILLQFVIGLVGVMLSEKAILAKPFKLVLTGAEKFRWGRALAAWAVWTGFAAVYQFATFLFWPESISYTVDWEQWLIFLPITILLVPLQCAFEEVAIRGQLMQLKHRLAPRIPFVSMVGTSIVFAGLHAANNEVDAYGAGFMMLHYFTFGLMLAAFAVMDEGLELSIGIHAANNVFAFCFVSYPESSLTTPTIFSQLQMNAGLDYMMVLVFMVMFFFIFIKDKRRALNSLVKNSYIPDYGMPLKNF